MKNITSQLKMFAMTCLIATGLAACVKDTAPAAPSTTTSVSGQAVAGAVTGSVTVSDANGTQLTTATVSNGAFTLTLNNSDLGQELDFAVTGSYRDEVSGQTVTLTTANPLALRLAANHFVAGQVANAPITPDTTIIREMVQTQAMTLTQAQNAFQTAFGYAPNLNARPFDPYTTTVIDPAATANNEAAFRAGMFSQLGADLNLTATDLAELPARFAADLADGVFDGAAAGNAVTFTSGVNLQTANSAQPLGNMISMALAKFAGNKTANIAGVIAPAMGLPPLRADMPGSTKVITLANGAAINMVISDVYSAPFINGFRNVKTSHEITLTYAASGLPVDITADPVVSNIAVKPWMYMFAGNQHGSPMSALNTANAVNGIYTFDVYYMMPTGMMMNGSVVPMGQWSLDVKIGDLSNAVDPYAHGHFFPNVMMHPTSDALLAKGSNVADQWTKMGAATPTPREYRIWLQDVVANAAGGHDLTVYVSTVDMMMNMTTGMGGMSFPAVFAGQTVHDQVNMMNMRPVVTLSTVTCEVSTDAGLTWLAMPAGAVNGQYAVTGLAGLNTAGPNTLDMRLTVNGNVMTVAAGTSPQLIFTAP